VLNWLGLGAVNSMLLWGSALVAAPIIIHLLSKRRFRTVDWAAMEFLLDAERRNRRRIRLEHLLLLLLRCLAVVLLAMLVARVFLQPTGLVARVVESARFERIVLLDDSPSMEARAGAGTVFDEARDGLAEFVRRTARDRPGDAFTLVTTSRPDRPILAGQLLAAGTVDGVVRTVETLDLSDTSAAYDAALLDLEEMLGSPRGNLNRQVLILTDFRRRDWQAAPAPPDEAEANAPASAAPAGRPPGLPGLLTRVADRVQGLALVNVGGTREANLTVADVAVREKTVVAGVPAGFEVTVVNYGPEDATDVEVTLTAGDAVPLRAVLDTVPAGGRATVPFTFTFAEAGPGPVRAEVPADVVPRDNVRYRAVRVRKGVPILLVDGEPSSEYGETETFYLQRALDPPGDIASGNDVRVITENQFEDLPLGDFQVIVLANLYRVTEGRLAALARWVREGGGLVVFLGDQVDEMVYNGNLAAEAGLLPFTLAGIRGDAAERQWVHLRPLAPNHPVLGVFAGTQNPFLSRVKVFRWWRADVPTKALEAGDARILAAYSDAEASPAIVENRLGEGRVLAVTTTADAEWTNWCADPSYLVTVLEATRYVTRSRAGRTGLAVGSPIRADLDPARFATEVTVEGPDAAEAAIVQAVPAGEDAAHMRLTYEDTRAKGFYRLHLKAHDGADATRLFAANVHPTEGDLAPADADALRRDLGGADVAILKGKEYLNQAATGGQAELWRPLLVALLVTLFAEQTLAWWFGRRR